MKQFKDSHGFAHLLNLLTPGLGHAFWGEYLFAAFVFLIMLIAVILFFFCFLVDLPFGLRLVLFGLPVLFYLFTFVDLHRSISKRNQKVSRSARTGWMILTVGLAAQLVLPIAPVNFLLRNPPDLMIVESDDLAPLLEAGDPVFINTVAYRADLFFFDRPLSHDLPDRWDLVRCRAGETGVMSGLVIGLTNEEVSFINDSLFVDGYPFAIPGDDPMPVAGGEMSLTLVDPGSILVATLENGRVHRVRQVPLGDIIGKVHRLF